MEAIMWGRGAKGSFFNLWTTNLRYIFEKVFEKKKYFEESFQKLWVIFETPEYLFNLNFYTVIVINKRFILQV